MNQTATFHSQNIVLRLALLSNIIGWGLMIFYLLSFISDIRQVASQWPLQMPADILEQLTTWSGLFAKLFLGGFYFAMMHGLSQLLYLGLDIYMDMHAEDGAEAESAGAETVEA